MRVVEVEADRDETGVDRATAGQERVQDMLGELQLGRDKQLAGPTAAAGGTIQQQSTTWNRRGEEWKEDVPTHQGAVNVKP